MAARRRTGNVIFKSGNGSDTYSLARLEVTGTTSITTAGTDAAPARRVEVHWPGDRGHRRGADLFAAGTALPTHSADRMPSGRDGGV